MVKVASCFSKVLSMVNRNLFERAVRRHGAERGAKGFSCWDPFVAMLFCQIGSAHSLREICGGLATAMGKLVHLGLDKAPGRSALAYANAHRPWQLCSRTCWFRGRAWPRPSAAGSVQKPLAKPGFHGD